jgi:hypothetical protein
VHDSVELSVGRLEFAAELIHGTNQLAPLPSQPLERLIIYKRLGSTIGHRLAGHSELLRQLHVSSHLFSMSIPVAIHEELRRRNMSEMPRKGTRVEGADVPYLAARDDNITEHAQRDRQGS